MRRPLLWPAPFLAALILLGASACSSNRSTDAAPAGANHTAHLRGTAISAPLSCDSCHSPTGFAVDFSQNPAMRAAGARFDPATKTCSNVSCHGAFNIGGVTGSHATPAWNDGSGLSCTSCHGMPPTGHPNATGSGAASTCSSCHADTVNPDGTINMATGAHMNGLPDVTGGACSSCHGDPSRFPTMAGVDPLMNSAPPVVPDGSPASAEGAHLIHMNPNPAVAASVPTLCNECHVVPSDATHATQPPIQKVVFGPRATANGASPSYDPTRASCSASYCHGNFNYSGVTGSSATMLWTDPTRIQCGSCHAMPPAGHPPVTDSSPAACSACHPTTVSASGLILPGGAHMNARADIAAIGCTGCHGDATRTASLSGADVNLASAPPVATRLASPSVVGAHLGHVNPSPSTALSGPVACAECHVVPGDFAHSVNPPAERVNFGPLAKTGGVAPAYAAGTMGCSATYCHGNFTFGGVSGARATVAWGDTSPMTCTSCHGMPPAGHPAVAAPVTAASCAPCHPKSINVDGSVNLVDRGHMNGLPDTSAAGCSACHGDAGRKGNLPGTDANLVSAPPTAPQGAPAFAVGAHQGHVNPAAATVLAAPIACAECHAVPTDSTHAKNPPPQRVVFGAIATAGGAAATWSATSTGCSATYCHGNFTFGTVKGSAATPLWTGTAALTCTSCHGMPPTGHVAVASPVTAASCAPCHPDTVNASGTINLAAGGHINGKSDVNALACTTCHGDATRKANLAGTDANLTSAPPAAPTGAPSFAVGAHQGHLNPTTASFVGAPVACAECHAVPSDAAHATNPPAQKVAFGTLSRTGGAAPAWNGATTGCSATYCHGNFTFGAVKGAAATPLWTDTSALTCTSCHGLPPTGHPTYAGAQTAASCFQCHPQSVKADGTILAGGGHLNGKADGGGCTSCHADPPATGKHQRSDHRRLSCDKCHPTGFTSATTVATFHRNGVVDLGSQAGYKCAGTASLVGCKTGQTRTCTNSCHGNETW